MYVVLVVALPCRLYTENGACLGAFSFWNRYPISLSYAGSNNGLHYTMPEWYFCRGKLSDKQTPTHVPVVPLLTDHLTIAFAGLQCITVAADEAALRSVI